MAKNANEKPISNLAFVLGALLIRKRTRTDGRRFAVKSVSTRHYKTKRIKIFSIHSWAQLKLVQNAPVFVVNRVIARQLHQTHTHS